MNRFLLVGLLVLCAIAAAGPYDSDKNLKYPISIWGYARPGVDNLYDLGTPDYHWRYGYIDSLLGAFVDTASVAKSAWSADSVEHKKMDVAADKIADSLAVKAPLTKPTFLDSVFLASGYPLKWGTAATSLTVKDTLGVRVRAVSADFDTVTIRKTLTADSGLTAGSLWIGKKTGYPNSTMYDAASGSLFFFESGGAIRFGTSAGVFVYGGGGFESATITGTTSITTPKIANGTSGIKVASDSLMITPEGGIAILAKNKAGITLYRGMLCKNDSIGFSLGSSTGAVAVVYDAAIAANAFGYFVIHGRCLASFDSAFAFSSGHGQWGEPADSGRIATTGGITDEGHHIGPILQLKYFGINGRRDSLGYIIVSPIFSATP
jgi:hypothetical protein